ncbi:hypothetical protein RPQ02_18615 [Streptomyces sp. AM2-3-1]|uniref:phosphorylase family protein n=1 Tax=Streptomyces sp. AM2-3-1 TaxID=3075824 RepID=UPI0028C3AA6F|nr:hypothetical protein [Streptomyces sp. AM2-3-1]WNO65671.1 hypothetical protein RPQ02_18615 [Streptomyces sp. AM2-3-1]
MNNHTEEGRPLEGNTGPLTSATGPRFGVVTALPKEFAAMKCMFDSSRRVPRIDDDDNVYVVGEIAALHGNRPHSVVLAMQPDDGNNMAAVVATHLLRSFPSVEYVLMVGIAGGAPHPLRPDRHVRLGDLVVSGTHGVVQYDYVNLAAGTARLRGTSPRPSSTLLKVVNYLEAERLSGEFPWKKHILRAKKLPDTRRPPISTDVVHHSSPTSRRRYTHPTENDRKAKQPKLHYGRIGAANTLLKDATTRDLLRDSLDIRAFEMEGSGIADAAWNGNSGFLVVRGICDYCDVYKNDIWQAYAAVVAAAYARALIEAF